MTKHFVQLHLHTEFSLLDGAIKIDNLLAFCKEQNWKTVGISDHGNIYGAVKFFQKAKKAGIKPILGCEMYLTPDASIRDKDAKYHHTLLIVQNEQGYKNLCQLMAFSFEEGFYSKPRIDYQMLERHCDGLIIGSGCVSGHIPTLMRQEKIEEAKKIVDWHINLVGKDRFYLEVMPPDFEKQKVTNKLLFEYAPKWGVNLLATNDAHYLQQEDNEAHEVLLAIQTKKEITDPGRMSFGDCKAYMRTEQQMLEFCKDDEQAVWNTGKIADMCNFEFTFGKLFFPTFPVPKKHTQETYFQKLCLDGLENIKQANLIDLSREKEYDDRLKLEMDLILSMGFVGYFLVVSDFIHWAMDHKIAVGPGRGSAAGSLVAWALKVTNVDPIKYNLLFERFLNPERVTMPDIDIDFCIRRREEVINYVKDKYGHDCVCQIVTFGTMQAKGVIKDVARALGFPFQDSNALTDLIPNQLGITLSESIEKEPRLKEMVETNPRVKHLIKICLKLEGLTRHASKHAAGVVISPEPLREMLPLSITSQKDGKELVTQYAMTELEAVGFLKMDFLGLKNLTVIEQTLAAIKKNHGVSIDLNKLSLSMDDKKTFELLCAGKTSGVFQFESDGIKEVMRKLQPEKFEDLIALNALYRPGPLGSGMVDDFIDRRHGRKKTTYMFPELEPILAETYGVIVYQEQVMKIASAIAGYSLGAADILRRAMGKKKVDVMAEQKILFVAGAKKLGFNEKKSAELFDLMAYFAGYGFNKSHSTAYALIAYHTAYLKANYPKEFLAALISFETSNPDKLTFYLQEISSMGIAVMPPSINRSEEEFAAKEDGILFGLKGIKNVGDTALVDIFKKREKKPFLDLLDFAKRIDLRTVNKRVFESLNYAGAFDELPGNRAQKLVELEKILALANAHKESSKTGQMQLFSIIGNKLQDHKNTKTELYSYQPLEDWDELEKLNKEKEVAGFYLSSHPLKTYAKTVDMLEHKSFAQTLSIAESARGKEPMVICCGLKQSQKTIVTKKGDRMAFAQFEDFSGTAEVIIFPRVFQRVEHKLNEYSVFLIKGFLDITSKEQCKIKANEIVPIDLFFDEWKDIRYCTINLPDDFDKEMLGMLTKSLPFGSTPLGFSFSENNTKLIMRTRKKIACTHETIVQLRKAGVTVKLSL